MGRRRKKGEKIDGWVNFYKPLGMTSTQAVGKVRWLFNAQKAGHAGTLDPLAEGILPIALGEATKTIPYIQDAMKTYTFTVTWGEARSTDDREGDVIATSDVRPDIQAIEAALPGFTGKIQQVPPKFSAIKIDGKRAYDLARDGEAFEIKTRTVHVESLEHIHVISNAEAEVSADNAHRDFSHTPGITESTFRMTCGKGTYVRSIARDMAEALGTVGYVSALKREKVGAFTEDNAIFLDFLEDLRDKGDQSEALLPLETALDDIPALAIEDEEYAKLKQGQVLSFVSKPDFDRLNQLGLANKAQALAVFQGQAIAITELHGATMKPVRVFNV